MNSKHLRMERAIRLEIGSGQTPRIGYKSCNIRPLPHIDHVCSADRLPFENNTVDEIYSRHLIEHFTLKEFLTVLKEWNRVLKNEGEVYIICPNLTWHLKQITESTHSSFYNKERGQKSPPLGLWKSPWLATRWIWYSQIRVLLRAAPRHSLGVWIFSNKKPNE